MGLKNYCFDTIGGCDNYVFGVTIPGWPSHSDALTFETNQVPDKLKGLQSLSECGSLASLDNVHVRSNTHAINFLGLPRI